MKTKLLLASVAALGLASAVAWAGMNVKQKDDGGVCFEFTSGVTQTDVYCWSALGVLDVAPATSAADGAATIDTMEITLNSPVDTTGTNTHNALTLDIGIGNATGGTNAVRGLQIDAIAGDASVTTSAVNIGAMTGTGATENAIVIGSGWDAGISTASPMSLSSTLSTTDDLTILTPGDLIIGNGTPSVTQNGEDAYVEGTFEVDGASEFDGAVDFDSTIVIDTTTIAENGLKFAARGEFTICGDITTVNANTVFYGPSQAVVDSATAGGVTCNTDDAGNVTEATADAPAVAGLAFVPLGMICYSTDMGATGSPLTYTFRAGAAYDSGAITLSIADNVLSGASPANTIGTTAVAADTAVSVSLTSAGDVGAGAFVCKIRYAY